MRTEILVTILAVLAVSGISGVIVGYRKGPEWGLGVFAVGLCLALLFPWDVLFR